MENGKQNQDTIKELLSQRNVLINKVGFPILDDQRLQEEITRIDVFIEKLSGIAPSKS